MGSNGVAPSKINRALAQHAAQQESALAQVIGETVALRLAELLPLQPWNPGCLFCVLAAKQIARDWQVACMNAAQAGEPLPEPPPEPQVAQAMTWVPVTQLTQTPAGPVPGTAAVPACWEHVQLPQAPPRQTGLVAPDGRPIVATAGQ